MKWLKEQWHLRKIKKGIHMWNSKQISRANDPRNNALYAPPSPEELAYFMATNELTGLIDPTPMKFIRKC